MPNRWARVLLALVFASGLLLRLTHLLEISRAPDFSNPQFESQYHDYWANALVTGDWQPPPEVTDPRDSRSPLLSPTGVSLLPRRCLLPRSEPISSPPHPDGSRPRQRVSTLPTDPRAVRSFHLVAAVVAAALALSSWILIFFESELMEPTLLITILLLILTVALRTDRLGDRIAGTGSWWQAGALGGLLGAGALVRPNLLVLAPVLLIWCWQQNHSRGTRLLRCFLLLTALAAAIVPVSLRNFVVSGQPVLISCNGGINLFIGLHPSSDGFTPGVPELGELTGLSGWDSFDWPKIVSAISSRLGQPMSDSEVSRFLAVKALTAAREDPLGVLGALGRKTLIFWGPVEISNNKILSKERAHSTALKRGPGFAPVLTLALLGLALLTFDLRRRPHEQFTNPGHTQRGSVLVLATILAVAASYLPFFAAARFRAPLIPLLIIFSGYAIATFFRWITGRHWLACCGWLSAALGCWLIVSTQWIPYRAEESTWHWRRGLLFQQAGDQARARVEFQRTIEMAPDDRQALLALGDSLAAGSISDLLAAIPLYRRVVALAPADGDQLELIALNNLATLLAGRLSDLDGAIISWERILELQPARFSAHINLASAFAQRSMLSGADSRRDLERATELAARASELADPDDPNAQAAVERLSHQLDPQEVLPPNPEQR